ncbi:hypothetical protein EV715DRAFT_268638, partial [Schizophyllum commune]
MPAKAPARPTTPAMKLAIDADSICAEVPTGEGSGDRSKSASPRLSDIPRIAPAQALDRAPSPEHSTTPHVIDTTSTCKCDATTGYGLTRRISANIKPPEACAGILCGYMRPTNRRRPARGPRAIEAKFGATRLGDLDGPMIVERLYAVPKPPEACAGLPLRCLRRFMTLADLVLVLRVDRQALWLMHDVGRAEMRRPAVRRIRARLEVSTSFGDLMQTPDRRRHARGFWASAAMAQCCRRQKRQGARSRGRATNRGCKIRLNEWPLPLRQRVDGIRRNAVNTKSGRARNEHDEDEGPTAGETMPVRGTPPPLLPRRDPEEL